MGEIWQCVKTNSTPVLLHQNSWDGKWMFIPLKMVLIGIDPYPSFSEPLVWIWSCGVRPVF
jgi:hypothetical protein